MIEQGMRRAVAFAVIAAGALLLAPVARGQDAGAAPKPEAPPPATGPSSGTCTFDVKDQSIDKVLEYVRRASGEVNIVVSPEAKEERVTLALRNAAWRDALDEIGRQTGCTIEEVNPRFLRVEKPPLVNFSFESADIQKVVRLIAGISGANIVSDPEDVKGAVTVNINNVPWRKALTTIVGTKGYMLVEESGGILRVVSPGKLQLELETTVYQLKFLRPPPVFRPKLPSSEYVEKLGGGGSLDDIDKAFNIIPSLRAALAPEGKLEYVSASNSLVLKGTKPKLSQVMKILNQLDVEPLQIFVDMQFVSTSNRDFLDVGMGPGTLGILGSLQMAKAEGAIALPFNTGKGGFEDTLLQKAGLPTVGSIRPTFSYGTLDFSSTSYFLRLLRNDTESRIVQAPKLFVLDNQEATIFVGESVRFAQTDASSSQSGTLQFAIKEASASPVSVGFQLLLVPHVIPGSDKVMITLVPSQKALTGTSTEIPGFDKFAVGTGTAAQVIFLPRESSSTLVTTLVCQHGVTSVLGGLLQDTEAKTVQKIPYLGDLPLIGWLFKTEQKSKTKSQLMIFLTPWLVRDAARQREAIEAELLRREPGMDKEWERLADQAAPPKAPEKPAEKPAPVEKKPTGPK